MANPINKKKHVRLLDKLFGRMLPEADNIKRPESNFRLFDPKNVELVARNKQLAAVREIAISVDKVRTIDEALSLAVEQARDIEGIRFVFVQKVDDTGEFVVIPYYSKIRNRFAANAIKALGFDAEKELGESPKSKKLLRFQVSKLKVAQDYLRNPRVMVLSSIAEMLDGVWPRTLCDSIQKIMGVKKIVIVPLLVEGESWGTMLYYLDKELPVDILEMIAAHCALAIKNIITLNSLELRNRELSATQEKLRESEERYRLIFESGNDIVLLLNKKGKIIDVNKNIVNLGGYRRDEIFGKNFRVLTKIMPKKSIAIIAKNFMLRLIGVNVPPYEVEIYHGDGELHTIEISAVAVRNGNKIIGTLATLRDVTELKKSTQAVKDSEEKFSKAFQFIPNACSITSLEDGHYIEINDSFTKITGYTKKETIGSTAKKLNLWADVKDGERIIPVLRKTGSITSQEITFRTKAAEIRHGIYSAEIIKLNGKDCVLVTINDITDRKRMEDELRNAIIMADAANRAKSDFLARMSHEIRTPIHGVQGTLNLLRDTELGQEQRQYVNMARASADTLLNVIDQILDFSKIEAGKLVLESINFDLRKTAEEALSTIAVLAYKKGVEALLQVSPDVPMTIIGDSGRLRQIIVNLLGNSVKFTERGEIVLRVDVETDSETEVELHFSVRDTGIGIPKEKHRLLFQPFEQVDGSTSRKYGGSGLGLSICQQLVKMMSGRIWFTSWPGEGSIFHFTAKFGKQAISERFNNLPQIPSELRGLPLLLVDDNATCRTILGDVLKRYGFQVTEADNVHAAFKELEDARGTSRQFRMVFLDKTMPKMNGFATAEKILRDYVLRPGLVMMLTSDNISEDFARCQELGISHYLVKPIKESELLDVILTTFGHAKTEKEPGRQAAPISLNTDEPKLRILVAEDNATSQLIARKTLEKAGHTVQIAGNGVEALRMFNEETFDLILMDVEMPEMDGLAATRSIREMERESGKHIPILAMTAYAMEEDKQRCLEAGMDSYLPKPVNLDELHSVISGISPLKNAKSDVVDIEAALKLVGGDEDILREVIDVFLEQDYPAQFKLLKDGIGQHNAQMVKAAAHSIKGAVRSFGSTALASTAVQLEEMGRNNDLTGAGAALEELDEAVKKFKNFFVQYNRHKVRKISIN